MSSTIENVVKDFLDAFSQHDAERTITYFTDDCVYKDMAVESSYSGKKELADFLNQLSKDFPDHKWKLKSMFSTDDKVAFESVWSGTHTFSSNPDFPASGNFVKVDAATIVEFQNDKIHRLTDYYNLKLP
jgi:steroid delta-isomerase-like uncharacterized protein